MSTLRLKQGNFSLLFYKCILFLQNHIWNDKQVSNWKQIRNLKKLVKLYECIIYTKILATLLILIIAATTKINSHANNNNNNNSVFAWVCGRSLCWCCRFESRQVQWSLYLVGVVCYQAEFSPSGWSFAHWSPIDCGVSECDRETSIMRGPRSAWGCCALGEKYTTVFLPSCYRAS
jgi:hypothetical protein